MYLFREWGAYLLSLLLVIESLHLVLLSVSVSVVLEQVSAPTIYAFHRSFLYFYIRRCIQ